MLGFKTVENIMFINLYLLKNKFNEYYEIKHYIECFHILNLRQDSFITYYTYIIPLFNTIGFILWSIMWFITKKVINLIKMLYYSIHTRYHIGYLIDNWIILHYISNKYVVLA